MDLTPRKKGGTARLLDMVEGRSEKAFATWLQERGQAFRERVRVVAMDAFAGYKKAAARILPHAIEVVGQDATGQCQVPARRRLISRILGSGLLLTSPPPTHRPVWRPCR